MTELLALDLKANVMHAVSLDGRSVRTVVDGLDRFPDGVVVDQLRGHIYWTNMGEPDPGADPDTEPEFFTPNGSIERVDLDGGNRTTIVAPGAFTTGKQLTADFEAGRLYWCDREGMAVLTCDLHGNDLHPIVVTGRDPREVRDWCVGICVDMDRRLVYWSQKGAAKAGDGRIFRAPIELPPGADPADRPDIELLWQDLPEPIDLELSGPSHLVWTDRGRKPEGNALYAATVQPEVGAPKVLSTGYREAIGLAGLGCSFYVSDLGGGIRLVDVASGTDTELARLGSPLTGLALADL
ncbi:hypothetical protein FEK33_01950 [Nocardia asteroides NBRC 15531]|uniref:Uncharacterized protein n=1 Tax=Nocardia asteroides NBRC 15531 TaxID=1110697 RepID=U5ED13_NOCAS|nr:hypothetical protein [Nocardia asteroides]TLF69114.1 hypothetical protein FEK33_01950 [Nocardia asteroides NBRC 15531]UGT48591.1 hypothetical protein LT345_29790 [Nocardia asteroides]SFL64745.1 hypothetical protein SAMN05444423_101398 [Nocardia asteroides]VEG31916.1 CAS/CSE protein involved in chromosome segregation [Nocardia asteroides]GAD83069.1 hypothetical protein NCAST_17_00510 [Nocardia asteroides NBRC 15531]